MCRAQKETCKTIDKSCMLLVDSGGQYDCGTTDITRTFHFGEPTQHQKDCYTRVLQVCFTHSYCSMLHCLASVVASGNKRLTGSLLHLACLPGGKAMELLCDADVVEPQRVHWCVCAG